MKILIIDEGIDRVGGVERVLATLSNKLCLMHEVVVLSEYKLYNEPFYFYNKKIKIRYMYDATKKKSKDFKEKNISYYCYRFFEKIMEYIFFKIQREKSILEFKDFDVIIFGRVFTAINFLPILRKYNFKSKIIVRDAIHIKYYSSKIKRQMREYFPLMVDKFIVSSSESITYYKNFFNNTDIDIKKIYNPLGIIPKKGYNFSKKTCISIGRMDEQKGYDCLIEAFILVHKTHPDWLLKLYGDGTYEQNLRDMIKKYHAEKYIYIYKPIKNVVEIMNDSSIFILTSRYEGYANILVEALSCGIPSLSFNWLMGVEEIIQDGKNGFIVPLEDRNKYYEGKYTKNDLSNLSKKIIYLIENPKLCSLISDEAVSIIDSRNLNLIVDQWIQIIT